MSSHLWDLLTGKPGVATVVVVGLWLPYRLIRYAIGDKDRWSRLWQIMLPLLIVVLVVVLALVGAGIWWFVVNGSQFVPHAVSHATSGKPGRR